MMKQFGCAVPKVPCMSQYTWCGFDSALTVTGAWLLGFCWPGLGGVVVEMLKVLGEGGDGRKGSRAYQSVV